MTESYNEKLRRLKAQIQPCNCGRKRLEVWNTGFWNIACPQCERIVSQVYLGVAVRNWNRNAVTYRKKIGKR